MKQVHKSSTVFFYFVFVFLLSNIGYTQVTEESSAEQINLSYSNSSLKDVLSTIEENSDIKIFYKSDDIQNQNITIDWLADGPENALDTILSNTSLSYIKYRDYAIVIMPKSFVTNEYSASYFDLLNQDYSKNADTDPEAFNGIIIGDINNLSPTGRATVKGTVLDGKNSEGIIGATIKWGENEQGFVTDVNGQFEAIVDVGEAVIDVQYIGYENEIIKVRVLSDGEISINLFEEAVALDEIVISERAANEQIESSQISVERLSVQDIKKLPTFLGEADVIQSVLIQPGVSTVGEGAIGFNVRGGDADQNLVIQDEALIFNTSHALGFFSTFNTDLIKGVDLYKGDIPSQYGGRLASVMDVQMRDGNFEDLKIKGSIGVFSAKVSAEGPISNGKTSFITGYRTSYSDWLLNGVNVDEVKNSSANFYDWNGRLTHKFSNTTSLTLAGYIANDDFVFNKEFGFDYSTKLGQLIFKNVFSNKFASATHIAYSKYNTTQSDFDEVVPSDFTNDITYYKFKEKLTFSPSEKVRVDGGVTGILYQVNPGERIPSSDEGANLAASLNEEKGLETAAFTNLNLSLTDRISINGGLRYSLYQFLGPNDVFVYEDGAEQLVRNITDTISYGSEVIETFSNLEPRVSLRVSLGDKKSIKAGYSRTAQYINQIFNTDSPTPTSQWQLSTPNILPNKSHNFSLGYFQNFKDNNIETSVTVFGRIIDQLFDYKGFADLLVNDHIETELLEGEGKAYGVELSLKKKTGKFNGSFSYTYSRSLREVPGINKGETFPSNFDKPHEGSLILNYQPNQRNTLSLNYTYAQGRPTTPPVAGFLTENNVFVPIFSERNQLRIPSYQRLDLAFTSGQGYKKGKKFRLSWTVSIYNLLGRENAYSVFFTRGSFNRPDAQQLSILGNAFPAITFNFEIL